MDTQRAERDAILEACCRDRQAAQVVFESQGMVIRGAFQWLEPERLVLMVWGDEGEPEPELPAACCVTFFRNRRTFAFVARARRMAPGSGRHATLELDVPEMVAAAEARRYPRIRVPPDAPLEASIAGPDGVGRTGIPVEISFSGIRLDLIEGAEVAEIFQPRQPATVKLKLEELTLDLDVVIAHRAGHELGIEFPETAEASVRGLVQRIEDGWG